MTRIRQAVESDWKRVAELLAAASLPAADLSPAALVDFLILEHVPDAEANIAGLVGLQQLGQAGLLRSLVVDTNCTGAGFGSQLLKAAESRAVAAELDEIWLLTIDADRFFSAHGYEVADRSIAPRLIRETDEFSSLCPDDAVLMHKQI